ncbi:MAG: hypothetical protein HKN26_06325, partial [Acidimicrobiales bacterium]|nr:hypothetical protein [Acidimicrobiales bacterium]
LDHPLTISLSRTRSDPQEPVRFDPEEALDREFELPSAREFLLLGEARLSAYVDDALIDELVGIDPSSTVARSSERLAGDLPSRARAAVDADPTTAWQTPFDLVTEQWLELQTPQPTTIDTLTFSIVADGRHSVPELLTLTVDDGPPMPIEIPVIADGPEPNRTETITVALPQTVSGSVFRFDIDRIRPIITKDWYSGNGIAMPVGIAEIREFAAPVALPASFDSGCRDDLLAVNSQAVAFRMVGSMTAALERQPLRISACTEPTTVSLPAGTTRVEAARGRDSGFDLDRLALLSPIGGEPPFADGAPVAPAASELPIFEVAADARTAIDLAVTNATEPFWLVLGQSHNPGWQATIDGLGDLGEPMLIDGFANGWYVDPTDIGSAFSVELRWTPQRVVNLALWFSLLAAIGCVALIALGRRATPTSAAVSARFIEGGAPANLPVSSGWIIAIAAAGGFAVLNLPRWHWLALVVVAASALSGRLPRVLPGLATACLIVAGAFTTIEQYRNRYPPDFGWPQFFESVHVIGVLCILLLAAEAVRALVRPDANDRPAPRPGHVEADRVGANHVDTTL